jgi:hypothetical protein
MNQRTGTGPSFAPGATVPTAATDRGLLNPPRQRRPIVAPQDRHSRKAQDRPALAEPPRSLCPGPGLTCAPLVSDRRTVPVPDPPQRAASGAFLARHRVLFRREYNRTMQSASNKPTNRSIFSDRARCCGIAPEPLVLGLELVPGLGLALPCRLRPRLRYDRRARKDRHAFFQLSLGTQYAPGR